MKEVFLVRDGGIAKYQCLWNVIQNDICYLYGKGSATKSKSLLNDSLSASSIVEDVLAFVAFN